ncbi:hypothetical protein EBAPG3_009325 [Nitrosospira lacus]|uniref:Uncharacterized protein n=1 Tax=Nitrosospira lacus TaxID=1288494 RepID=A0A1W6SQ62_9PROT|nr:hypothetical protein [Nitrosospira lacus]ARO87950.1 hypothetical protein EBAPG3_009325 [Nitrosospira lacus]
MATKQNAPAATEAIGKTKLNPNYKRIPAYGKQFMEMRRSGKVPSKRVMVTFDWDLAQAYPRIVLADDTPADQLNFSYLAGLPVQVIYRRKDSHRVSGVIDSILQVNPSCLATFAIDLVGTGDAVTLIKAYERTHTEVAA